jgi:hypothetical protein
MIISDALDKVSVPVDENALYTRGKIKLKL